MIAKPAPRPIQRPLLALVATLAWIVGPPGAHAEDVPRPQADFFGLNAQRIVDSPYPRDVPAALAQNTDAIAGLGVRLIRLTFDWRDLEPQPPLLGQHTYRWDRFDPVVAQAARSGIRVYPQIAATPAWATDAATAASCVTNLAHPAPTDLDAYADAAAALIERYGPQGAFWDQNPELPRQPVAQYEVNNEPNWSFWCPHPDPEAYADLALRTAQRVHAVAPEVEVVLGGLAVVRGADTPSYAMATDEFLTRAFAARPELVQQLGAVGVHAYAGDVAGVIDKIAWMRQIVDGVGGQALTLDVNEFGWPTAGGGTVLDERSRAQAVGELASELWRTDCGIERIFLHTWRTRELESSDREDWYGVADPTTAEPYPTAEAYAAALSAATGAGANAAIEACGDPAEASDTEAPRVRIDRVRVRGRGLRAKYSADEPAIFHCRLDRRRWGECSSPARYRAPRGGRHRFAVRATDAAGNVASAAERFRIRAR